MKFSTDSERLAAIDVETATKTVGSICEVGIAFREEGNLVSESWLVRPPGNKYYEPFVELHGVTPDMTKGSPGFCDVWPEVQEMLTGRQLVAHNAKFDVKQIKYALRGTGSATDQLNDTGCTLNMAHLIWFKRERSFKLSALCDDWGIALGEDAAHDASNDATATLQLADLLLEDWYMGTHGNSLDELILASNTDAQWRAEQICDRVFRINHH